MKVVVRSQKEKVLALIMFITAHVVEAKETNLTAVATVNISAEGDDSTANEGSTAMLAFLGLELVIGVGLLSVFAVVMMSVFYRRDRYPRAGGTTLQRVNTMQQPTSEQTGVLISTPLVSPVESAVATTRNEEDELAYTITEIGPLICMSLLMGDDDSDSNTTSQEGMGDSIPNTRQETGSTTRRGRPCYSTPPPPSLHGLSGEEAICNDPELHYAQLELVPTCNKQIDVALRKDNTEYAHILGELKALVNTPMSFYPN